MITLVDYGVGNSDHSQYAERTSDPDIVASAQKLLLPGVGAFDHAMVELQAHGMVVNEAVVRRGMMLLGICLGMHLMTDGSAEGRLRGLGWIKSRAERFTATTAGRPLRVPHMGWAGIDPVRASTGLSAVPRVRLCGPVLLSSFLSCRVQ